MADPDVKCYDPRYPRPYFNPKKTPVTNMLDGSDERISFPSCTLAQRELMTKPDLGLSYSSMNGTHMKFVHRCQCFRF
jgi:hypothetical protein